jgi:GNAT superfamily N-acetyltransferase
MQLKRNDQQDEFLTVIQLTTEADFLSEEVGLFNCGDDDLNEFLLKDAWNYKRQLLAETYLCYPTNLYNEGNREPIAYISLCNDCIHMKDDQNKLKSVLKAFYNKCIKKSLPHKKRSHKSFPAVKIARLAVHKGFHSGGVGTHLLNMTKSLFLNDNRTGCKFLTIDAYNNEDTIRFYVEKNKFQFLWDSDKGEEQRILWFNLSNHQNHQSDKSIELENRIEQVIEPA